MTRVKLKVLGLSYSQTFPGSYLLVLSEEDTNRRIPIVIGGFEAQAIAIALENLLPPRPLTHDLIINFTKTYNISIKEVFIHRLEDGIFYAELLCDNGDSLLRIDSRTSDAVAVALRCQCPIYTTEQIIEKAGVILNLEEDNNHKTKSKNSSLTTSPTQNKYKDISLKDLKVLLNKSISNEDYEEASHIRDEIRRRESK